MSLRTTINRAATQALRKADSLAVTATYTSKGSATYDADAGTSTSTDQTAAIRVFLVSVLEREIDRPVQVVPNTKKAIFDRRGFPFEAKAEDSILLSGGADAGTWEVTSVLSEPSSSIYVLEVRRP